jgi:hypothetical protein
MAGFFQQFLKGSASGFLRPEGEPYLKDYAHASKIFLRNGYENVPKFKWLFHVYFDINKTQITDRIEQIFPSTHNHGLLVKTVELPKFSMAVQELNQYNRKRYVQTKINYDPVSITFHDDNMNTIRHLWYTYYSYHYNDPSQGYYTDLDGPAPGSDTPAGAAANLNKKNVYDLDISEQQNWGYIGEPSRVQTDRTGFKNKAPFFRSISVFGFNQHNFVQYQYINPIIESFKHDSHSYTETSGTMENSMSLRYELVKYYEGALDGQDPSNIVNRFGETGSYDQVTSPISRPGSTRTIMGQGGLVDAAGGIVGDLANGDLLGALRTVNRTRDTFKNANIRDVAKSDLVSGINDSLMGRGAFTIPSIGSNGGTSSQNLANGSVPSKIPPVIK